MFGWGGTRACGPPSPCLMYLPLTPGPGCSSELGFSCALLWKCGNPVPSSRLPAQASHARSGSRRDVGAGQNWPATHQSGCVPSVSSSSRRPPPTRQSRAFAVEAIEVPRRRRPQKVPGPIADSAAWGGTWSYETAEYKPLRISSGRSRRMEHRPDNITNAGSNGVRAGGSGVRNRLPRSSVNALSR